jgi:protein-ribulosamine 3-kinase
MKLPVALLDAIQSFLRSKFSDRLVVHDFQSLSGGCINPGGKLRTTEGPFFVKWNAAEKYRNMFQAEARGLTLLASAAEMKTPTVIGVVETTEYQSLILSFVEHRAENDRFWETFGKGLANLHQHSQAKFGLDHDNYIGLLAQRNDPHHDWITFFIERRIRPQLTMSSMITDRYTAKKFESLFERLPSLLHSEKPSLLHGDLWRGNLISAVGDPCLIDPATYYGHREVDLAMTQLFGGFDSAFIESYHEVFPLEYAWRDRLDIYKLYPLLVHLNIFGDHYAGEIVNILNRFA